ncbi:MAG: hypothetical protein LBG46_05145 [Elusimicrobiota bacterium]|jgi:spore photoproduct lyase|nr:hypothetical protein [Elusimicrobiota bacterium]
MNIIDTAAKAQEYANEIMPFLGINKKREIARLLFEIAKRDNLAPPAILPPQYAKNFEQAKKFLISKRYPKNFKTAAPDSFYLPDLNLNFTLKADLKQEIFYPKNIFIENGEEGSPAAQNALKLFPKTSPQYFDYKNFPAAEANYSKRKETLIITKEKFDFVKPCPCTRDCFCCGYNLINLGFGCAYECAYCFLQQYQNLHAIILPANISDFLKKVESAKFKKGIFPYARVGSGEFTDSLIFDNITNYSKDIVTFFRGRAEYFEFKTKSVNIDNLLNLPPAGNVAVGWSVNPQNIIDETELLTPSLKERLCAAAKIAAHGFKTAFHFDPVILHDGWRENYKKVLEEIENALPKESILWFSLGTLRFKRELKKFIEARFADNSILDEEFLLAFDGKLRYADAARKEVYDYLRPLIKQKFPAAVNYLCMEKQI